MGGSPRSSHKAEFSEESVERYLYKEWFHSVEESDQNRIVYRTAGFDFPRSRRPRNSVKFNRDQSLSVGGPGPADARRFESGQWTRRGGVISFLLGGSHEDFEIKEITEEILVLKRIGNVKG